MWELLKIANYLVLVYFLILNISYLTMSVVAILSLRRYVRRLKTYHIHEKVASATAPPVTLLAPMYNEGPTCVVSTRSLLTLAYPQYEILVVNDGSKDDTLENMTKAFDLAPAIRYPTSEIPSAPMREVYQSRTYPRLWVLDKENGGKADALNTGVNYCRTPLFCAIDGDTLLERDALMRVVRPFMEDATTVVSGGIIRIVNDCPVRSGSVTDVRMPKNWVARFQVMEYLRAFLSGRVSWDVLNMVLIISGAFGLFKRSTVVACGGYYKDTVGEDMELIVRMHRYCLEQKIPYRIRFLADPVAWTECPESLKVLGRQRDRWHRGLAQVLSMHKKMMFNPKYGRVGMLAFPFFYFLELLGPVIEAAGYIIFVFALLMGALSGLFTIVFLIVALILGIIHSLMSVTMEEISFRRYRRVSDLGKLFMLAILENFGYRQLSVWWRIKGLYSYFRKVEKWGKMERKGFSSEATTT